MPTNPEVQARRIATTKRRRPWLVGVRFTTTELHDLDAAAKKRSLNRQSTIRAGLDLLAMHDSSAPDDNSADFIDTKATADTTSTGQDPA